MMIQRWAKNTVIITITLLLASSTFVLGVAKAASQCSASVFPDSMAMGENKNFDFTVTNTGSSSINWIDITVPNENFSYTGNSVTGWDTTDHQGGTTLVNSNLGPGDHITFTISVYANTVDSGQWQIRADDSGGEGPNTCSGSVPLSVFSNPSQINISNAIASEVGTNYALITWDTDVDASSRVYYSEDYSFSNATPLDENLVTSHSVTIDGLSSNSSYNFYIVSTTPDGGYAESGQNTFLTATEDQQGNGGDNGNGGNNNGANSGGGAILGGGIPILKKPIEKTPPTIKFTSTINTVYKVPPTINGQADDNLAVARVQYSTDGGKNWLPVTQATSLGGKHVTFSFTPPQLNDGTYSVLARAIDTSGNIGVTAAQKIVIAKLMPVTGAGTITAGSQTIIPGSDGKITAVIGLPQKITLSAVGGPTNVYITAILKGGSKASDNQTFTLTKSVDSGLWSGVARFSKPGQYQLIITAVNGAGIKGSRSLYEATVLNASQTINQKTKKAINATVNVYYYQNESKKWVLWDGSAYGQVNPQIADMHGNVKLFLPPGKYYLQAKASGYQTLISRIFESKQNMPLTTNLELNPLTKINLGPLHAAIPAFTAKYVNISSTQNSPSSQNSIDNSLIGKQLPNFNLSKTDGTAVRSINLLGKPAAITFGST